MSDHLEAACDAVHDVTSTGWCVGRLSYHDERREWAQCTFDQREQAKVGVMNREWIAVGATEVECLLELALPAGAERGAGTPLSRATRCRRLGR